jgi:hypothetical protein
VQEEDKGGEGDTEEEVEASEEEVEAVPPYLTECIYSLVLESQLTHKIVNLLFTITNSNIKLTVLWGS